jgi:dolichol-phosphate mannosyltransferase
MTVVRLSAVLPTYNERDNVIPLVDRIRRSLGDLAHEIVVVDDDSPDGTAAAVEAYAAGAGGVRVIRRVGRRGLRSAIQEGIDASTGEAVVWMDCDLSMPPEKIPELHGALATHDVAIGSRYVAGGRDARSDVPLHRASSRALNVFARCLLGSAVRDYTTGFVCARRRVLRDVRLAGEYGEYCIDFLHRARKRGFRIAEIPYVNTARAAGASKTASSALGLARRGAVYVAVVVRLFLAHGR